MSIELIPARAEHFADVARICHLAFNSLHTRHNVSPEVPSEKVGQLIIGGVLGKPGHSGVVAVEAGRVIGSNFIGLADEVGGVGPITVDPAAQSRGVGRALMSWAIDEARRQRGHDVDLRLYQEAINTTSLSLYTSLGFQWRHAAALMQPKPAERADESVRPMTAADLPAVERLTVQHYGASRANDVAARPELPAFVMERAGRVVGYHVATLFGHAAADTNELLLALVAQTARHVDPPMAVVIVPLDQRELFSAALANGWRVAKVLNYMSLATFRPLPGPMMPSIQC